MKVKDTLMELNLEFEDVNPGMILIRIVGEKSEPIDIRGWWQLYIVKEKTEKKLKGIKFQRKGADTQMFNYNISEAKWRSQASGFENTMTHSNHDIIQGIF